MIITDSGKCPKGNRQGAKMEIMEQQGSILEPVVREDESEEVIVEDQDRKEHSGSGSFGI